MRQLLRAHEYWRMKGLAVDLVIVNEQATSYAPELVDASSPWSARGPGRSASRRRSAGASSSCAASCSPARSATRSRRPRASSCSRGTGRWRSRSCGCCGGFPRLRPARPIAGPAGGSESAASPRSARVLQRAGRLFRGRGEYVTILGEGQWTPAPWINVLANARIRLSRVGVGIGLHLGGQQPREPAHALVERSRQRPARRGALPAGRGDGRDLVPHPPSDPGRRSVRRPPRPGIQPIRARARRHRDGPSRVRAAGRPGQDLAARASRTAPVATRTSRSPPTRSGSLGPQRAAGAPVHRHRAGCGNGRALRAQRVERGVRRTRRVRGPRGPARPRGRPIAPSFSGETADWTSRRVSRRG